VPGHLLTTLGLAGHAAAMALLLIAGLAVAVSLVVRPPATITAAALRAALLLALLFALSPATRFGYLDYPLALCGWLALTTRQRPPQRCGELAACDEPALAASG
jgi:hypothetical protein